MDIETVDIEIRKKIANRRIRLELNKLKNIFFNSEKNSKRRIRLELSFKFIIQKIIKLELKNLNFKVYPRSVN